MTRPPLTQNAWRRAADASASWTAFSTVALVFLGLLWLLLGATHPTSGGDTVGWEASAAQLQDWRHVFATQRPPLYPLLIRMAGFSHVTLAAIQAVIYAASWIVLAASLWQRSLLLAAATFYVGLYPGFAGWIPVILTESTAISLTVLAFACLVRFGNGRRMALHGFVALTILRCFLRNFDVVFCLLDMPLLLVLASVRALHWRSCLILSTGLLACIVFFANFQGYADYTWYFALLSDVGVRVLPDPDRLRFFAAHGMPVTAKLLSMSGHYAWENNWQFFQPELAPFRGWLHSAGRRTYMADLLRHPIGLAATLWQQRALVFQPGGVPRWSFDPATRFGLVPWPPFAWVYAANSLGVMIFAVQAARRAVSPDLIAPVIVAAGSCLMLVPAAAAAYEADPSDIARHCLPVLVQAALAMLLMGQIALRWWRHETLPSPQTDLVDPD